MRRIATILALGLAWVATPALGSVDDVTSVRTSKLHARLVEAPRPTGDATMVISFAVGAADDGIRAGLTRLTQHMLVDGTTREPRGMLRRDLYAAAAELDVITGVREATFVLRAPRVRFDELAERMLIILLAGDVDRTAVERCKRLTLRDEVDAASPAGFESLLAGELYLAGKGSVRGADFRSPPFGTTDVVRGLTFADVQEHQRRYFVPANSTVVVAGAFDGARIRRVLAGLKGGREAVRAAPVLAAKPPITLERWAGRSAAFQAHLLTIPDEQATAAAHILLALLEDRLRARVPQAGTSSSVLGYPLHRSWTQAVVVEIPGAGGEVDEPLADVAASLAGAGIAGDEFERNRTFALRQLDALEQDSYALALTLAATSGGPQWVGAPVRAALKNLTLAEFARQVSPWLAPDHTIRAHVGRSFPAVER